MDEEVRFGDNFEVTIRFSGHPLRVLKTCAEVVRVSPYLNNRFEIGMKFKDLTEAEKKISFSPYFFRKQEKNKRK